MIKHIKSTAKCTTKGCKGRGTAWMRGKRLCKFCFTRARWNNRSALGLCLNLTGSSSKLIDKEISE